MGNYLLLLNVKNKIYLFKVSMMTGFKEEEIMKLGIRIIKFCLGNEIYKKYNFN